LAEISCSDRPPLRAVARHPCAREQSPMPIMSRFIPLLAFAAGCEAWGPDGHTIVAHIGDSLLDPKVHDVLLQDLGSTSLSDAATWCDDFDHSPTGRWSEPLHFINYPGQTCAFNWARDCKNDMCNVGALLNYSGQVFDRTTSKASRLVALKFVIHMMGDLHQPLHVASAADRGGNDIHVETDFAPSGMLSRSGSNNLHRVWDTTLVEQIISELSEEQNAGGVHNWQVLSKLLVDRLQGEWNQNLTEWRKVVAEDDTDSAALAGLPAAVAAHRNETLLRAGLSYVAGKTAAIGCTHAYVRSDGSRIQSGDSLDRDYFEWARPTVEIQLAKAGARLAQILSDSLALSEMAEVALVI